MSDNQTMNLWRGALPCPVGFPFPCPRLTFTLRTDDLSSGTGVPLVSIGLCSIPRRIHRAASDCANGRQARLALMALVCLPSQHCVLSHDTNEGRLTL